MFLLTRSANAGFLDLYQLKAQHYVDPCFISTKTIIFKNVDDTLEVNVASVEEDELIHTMYPGKSTQRGKLMISLVNVDFSIYTNLFLLTCLSTILGFGTFTLTVNYIIRALGFQMDTSLFDSTTMPSMDNRKKYPLVTPTYESENVPNLFFAGTIMSGRDRRRSSVRN